MENHEEEDELVLTPMGYRPKKSVMRVGPNEAISYNEEGIPVIVPLQPDQPEEGEKPALKKSENDEEEAG